MDRFLDDNRIKAILLEENSSEEEIGSDEDDNEERVVNESDHDTDSEFEIGQKDMQTDTNVDYGSSEEDYGSDEHFICKDKVTKWYKTPHVSKFAKTHRENIVKTFPGPINNARLVQDEVQAFQMLISDAIIEEIVRYTNIHIANVQSKYQTERHAKNVTKTELMAFLGLLFLSGVKRARHTNFRDLWATDGSGIEIFRACMSYNRFLFLLSAIRFDDKSNRNQRKTTDKLAAIRFILDEFVKNCKSTYCLSEFFTIDEMLVPFRGRCGFIQYMPNKPAKYGIKIFALCDAKTFFTGNLEVYCGKQPNGPYNFSSGPSDIVTRLTAHMKGTCRNLTTDNWYTSYPLAVSLLKDKITLVGTLKKNKKEIPFEFLPNKNKEVNSSMFGFQKQVTLVSFTPKKNKSVVLLSTMHHDASVDTETKKPEIVHFYNSTKGGVDTVDQLCGNYSVSRRTRRWPLCIFFQLLNIAGVNGLILHNMTRSEDKAQKRRQFLKNLAMGLIKPHMENRALIKNLPVHIRCFLAKYKSQQEEDTAEPPAKLRKRCRLCGRMKNRVTTMRCVFCNDFVCKEHSKREVKCDTCANPAADDE